MSIQQTTHQLGSLKNKKIKNLFEEAIVSTYDTLYGSLTTKQKEIFNDTSRFKIVQGVRQCGKSRLINTTALLTAMFIPNKTIFIGSFNIKASKYNLEEMKRIYMELPKDGKPGVIRWNSNMVMFENTSTIHIGEVNENICRYMPVDMILLDEIAFSRDVDIRAFVESTFQTQRCEIVIASSRANRSKKNFFWNTWIGAGEGFNDFKRFAISSKDCTFCKRSANATKEWKKHLGRAKYEHEHIIRWS